MTTPLLEGFGPVVDDRAEILILGSFPSVASLAVGQYYANPRNAFWSITGDLYGFEADAAYENRLGALQSAGIALWDVLHRCRRLGSLDAKIDRSSMTANDFATLFDGHPRINRVYFNGTAAQQFYRRLVACDSGAEFRVLPSSSPARAMPAGEKLRAWRSITAS